MTSTDDSADTSIQQQQLCRSAALKQFVPVRQYSLTDTRVLNVSPRTPKHSLLTIFPLLASSVFLPSHSKSKPPLPNSSAFPLLFSPLSSPALSQSVSLPTLSLNPIHTRSEKAEMQRVHREKDPHCDHTPVHHPPRGRRRNNVPAPGTVTTISLDDTNRQTLKAETIDDKDSDRHYTFHRHDEDEEYDSDDEAPGAPVKDESLVETSRVTIEELPVASSKKESSVSDELAQARKEDQIEFVSIRKEKSLIGEQVPIPMIGKQVPVSFIIPPTMSESETVSVSEISTAEKQSQPSSPQSPIGEDATAVTTGTTPVDAFIPPAEYTPSPAASPASSPSSHTQEIPEREKTPLSPIPEHRTLPAEIQTEAPVSVLLKVEEGSLAPTVNVVLTPAPTIGQPHPVKSQTDVTETEKSSPSPTVEKSVLESQQQAVTEAQSNEIPAAATETEIVAEPPAARESLASELFEQLSPKSAVHLGLGVPKHGKPFLLPSLEKVEQSRSLLEKQFDESVVEKHEAALFGLEKEEDFPLSTSTAATKSPLLSDTNIIDHWSLQAAEYYSEPDRTMLTFCQSLIAQSFTIRLLFACCLTLNIAAALYFLSSSYESKVILLCQALAFYCGYYIYSTYDLVSAVFASQALLLPSIVTIVDSFVLHTSVWELLAVLWTYASSPSLWWDAHLLGYLWLWAALILQSVCLVGGLTIAIRGR